MYNRTNHRTNLTFHIPHGSEKTTVSNVAPRGWGAGKPEMLDEEEEDLESWCSEDEAAEMMQHTQAAKNNRWEGSTTISMKGPVLTDEQFDKTLEEYGDHDIGGLSDVCSIYSSHVMLPCALEPPV